jgi:hypothetical protein
LKISCLATGCPLYVQSTAVSPRRGDATAAF